MHSSPPDRNFLEPWFRSLSKIARLDGFGWHSGLQAIGKGRLAHRGLALLICFGLMVGGCGLPQVSAESRLLLPLSVDFLGAYLLPAQQIMDTPVGGLSALAYDRQTDQFLALSDDRSNLAPARFYTLKISWRSTDNPNPSRASISDQNSAPSSVKAGQTIDRVTVENVTILRDESGEPFAAGEIDPEGLAITPRNTVLISSEGDVKQGIPPMIREFDRKTGMATRSPLPLPSRYLPGNAADGSPQGIRDNLGFEALGIVPVGANPSPVEPFRAFTATEENLAQDLEPKPEKAEGDRPTIPPRSRILHFSLGDGPPFPISEHLYEMDPASSTAISNGLVDLMPLDQGGHFLSLERTFDPLEGFGAKLFQVELGTATDTSSYANLRGALPDVKPAYKKLLLDFKTLGIPIDNLEGLTLGPQLPDGRQSIILVSDNNFREAQVTQFILLALDGFKAQ